MVCVFTGLAVLDRVFGQDARQKYVENLRTIEQAGASLIGVWEGSISIGDEKLKVNKVRVSVREVCNICKNKLLVASFELDSEDTKLPFPPHGEFQSAAKGNELKLFLGNEGNSEFCTPMRFLRAWPIAKTSGEATSLFDIRVFHDLGPMGNLVNRQRDDTDRLDVWGSSLVKVMVDQDRIAGGFRGLEPSVSFEFTRLK